MSVADFEAGCAPKHGLTLIVGSRIYGLREDRRKRYTSAVGVDMQAGLGVDLVADLETQTVGTYAHIDCLSVLEHCKRPWLMAANIVQMLEPDGTLLVTAPFVWRVHGYPDDYWRFTLSGIRLLFDGIQWDRMAYSHRRLSESFDEVQAVRDGDWSHYAVTESCAFGRRV